MSIGQMREHSARIVEALIQVAYVDRSYSFETVAAAELSSAAA